MTHDADVNACLILGLIYITIILDVKWSCRFHAPINVNGKKEKPDRKCPKQLCYGD